VSQVIGRMQNSGLVELNDDLKLSQKGEYLAKMISRRHRIIERFLTEVLDLPWEKVYAETKKWENVLSPVTEEAMLKILGNGEIKVKINIETDLIFQTVLYAFQIFVFEGSTHPISSFLYITQNPEP